MKIGGFLRPEERSPGGSTQCFLRRHLRRCGFAREQFGNLRVG
jgi:hypothetical protein